MNTAYLGRAMNGLRFPGRQKLGRSGEGNWEYSKQDRSVPSAGRC